MTVGDTCLRYAEELRLREVEARMGDELASAPCTTLDATAVRARRCVQTNQRAEDNGMYPEQNIPGRLAARA